MLTVPTRATLAPHPPRCVPPSCRFAELHMVEGPAAGVEWAKENWLQYTDGAPFLRL